MESLDVSKASYRVATVDDAEQIMEWWNDGKVMAHAGFPNGIGISKEGVIAHLKPSFFVIEYDGILIGECNYIVIEKNKVSLGIKICETDFQNKGLGAKILKSLISALYLEGYVYFEVDTNLNNVRAQHFYEKLGFVKQRICKDSFVDQLGNYQSSVEYLLILDSYNTYCNFINKK